MLKSLASALSNVPLVGTESRLRKVRLIACDLDGTLLNRDGMIGPTTGIMIKKIIEIGVPFVVITARHHQAVEPYTDELRLKQPIVSLDGAVISLPHADAPMNVLSMDREFALDILDEARLSTSLAYCAITPHTFYVSIPDAPLPSKYEHWNIEQSTITELEGINGEILEVIVTGDFYAINKIFKYVEARMKKGELKLRMYESHSKTDLWFLEIRSAQATKLVALERLIESMKINIKDVVGIGDHRNDIEFCEKAGFVVAVQNAVKELKREADFITERDCLDEGINEFLQLFLKARGVDMERALEAITAGPRKRERSR